jgi:hypothetical protein
MCFIFPMGHDPLNHTLDVIEYEINYFKNVEILCKEALPKYSLMNIDLPSIKPRK